MLFEGLEEKAAASGLVVYSRGNCTSCSLLALFMLFPLLAAPARWLGSALQQGVSSGCRGEPKMCPFMVIQDQGCVA